MLFCLIIQLLVTDAVYNFRLFISTRPLLYQQPSNLRYLLRRYAFMNNKKTAEEIAEIAFNKQMISYRTYSVNGLRKYVRTW